MLERIVAKKLQKILYCEVCDYITLNKSTIWSKHLYATSKTSK